MSDWQDIETAPRDGTHFLAWNAADGVALVVFDDDGLWTTSLWEIWPEEQDWHPTHWMPLPVPPVTP